ncbi:MAG: hypothetical protein DMG06_22400 [Acidobacteria bacterium]|nr:MAG: hypothetical protein DMG06_22400 [Acidobacteriota bacterium]
MNEPDITCLLSHKCTDSNHQLADGLINAFSKFGIKLLKDPLHTGDHIETRIRTFEFDALLFLS